jgi:hypothetical protein
VPRTGRQAHTYDPAVARHWASRCAIKKIKTGARSSCSIDPLSPLSQSSDRSIALIIMDVDEGNVNLVSEAGNARGVMRIYYGVHSMRLSWKHVSRRRSTDAAEKYWRTVARFGAQKLPVVPFRTIDKTGYLDGCMPVTLIAGNNLLHSLSSMAHSMHAPVIQQSTHTHVHSLNCIPILVLFLAFFLSAHLCLSNILI